MSPEEIKKAIYERGGEAFRVKTALEVFPTVAPTLEGVSLALDWLTSQLALRMARRSRFSPSALWAKATHYPASFVKSAYHRVVGLVSVSKGGEEEEEEEEEEGKMGSESVEVGGK
ncbi:uncharacterized protein LOC143278746 [Babylonia areolata]|uniref:uncharacterized protein LOC143278746 n=1 Tax=Babylonia areolata TaxID=304850 RepID=UPI003FD179EC